ncbi:MAG: glycosyltransferase family 4 protein [Bdellovibrionota bacterium]
MKFVFIPQSCIAFHAHTLDERPLGGIETAVIRLAAALDSLGQDVTVMTPVENPPLSQPLYLPFRALQDLGPTDVLIAVRDWQPLLLPLKAKRRLFWTGDSYDQAQSVGIGDRRVQRAVDWFCAVSGWHAETICAASGFPSEKTYLLQNGIHPEYFTGSEARVRKRLIYSSTPYRGLQHVPGMYRQLKQKHPELELKVFSGYGVYAGSGPPAAALKEYEVLKSELESMPGCSVVGSVTQIQLAREMMRASLLFYPNTFEETSCITAMEAQAAGCAIVTSKKGALPETVGDAGILIDGEPGSAVYQSQFLDAADRLLSDDALFDSLSSAGLSRAKGFGWQTRAEQLVSFLRGTGL